VALASGPQNLPMVAGIHMRTTPADNHTMAAECRNFQAEAIFENKNKLTACSTPDRALCIVIDRTDPNVPLVVVHALVDKDNKVSPDGTHKVLPMQSKCYLYPLRGAATDAARKADNDQPFQSTEHECTATTILNSAEEAPMIYSFTSDPTLGSSRYLVRARVDLESIKPYP
jgi:hypothetical protein